MQQTLRSAVHVRSNLRQRQLRREILGACGPLEPREKRTLGTSYGGWTFDPSLVRPDSVVYSFGLGEDVSFDLALIREHGVAVHGFEPDPLVLEWLSRQELPDRFELHGFGLAGYDGEATMHPTRPVTTRELSGARTLVPGIGPDARDDELQVVAVKRLPSIVEELGHDRIDLLKIDVEGAEYDVLDDLVASGLRPAQLLLEFHHHLAGIPLDSTLTAIRNLRAAGFRPFHVSQRAAEISFVG